MFSSFTEPFNLLCDVINHQNDFCQVSKIPPFFHTGNCCASFSSSFSHLYLSAVTSRYRSSQLEPHNYEIPSPIKHSTSQQSLTFLSLIWAQSGKHASTISRQKPTKICRISV